MKLFGLQIQKVYVGSVETGEEIDAIVLGERGPGRWRVFVPVWIPPASNGRRCDSFRVARTRSGKPKIIPGGESDHRWLLRACALGGLGNGAPGQIRVLGDPSHVEVIANGYGGFGDHGREARWDDYLLAVEPNTWIKIHPSGGGLYPDRYLWVGRTRVVSVIDQDLAAFCETHPEVPEPGRAQIFEHNRWHEGPQNTPEHSPWMRGG